MSNIVIIYVVFLFIFVVYSAAGIYHLWRFGYSGDLSKLFIAVYVIISIAIIFTSLLLIAIKYAGSL